MDDPVAHVTHAFKLEFVPRGGRNPRRESVLATTPVTVARASASDHPVALVADRAHDTSNHTFPILTRETYRSVDGRLVSDVVDGRGIGLGIEALVRAGEGDGPAWARRSSPFETGSITSAVRPEGLAVRRVVHSGEEEARAVVRAAAAGSRLLDGVLAVPAAEPVWTANLIDRHDAPAVIAVYPYEYDGPSVFGNPTFRGDNRDGVLRYAEWLRTERARHGQDDVPIRVFGAVEVFVPGLLRHDEATVNTERLAYRAFHHNHGQGFHELPIPALRAWVDFREAYEAHGRGEPGNIADCLRALCRIRDALPEGSDLPARRYDGTAAGSLANILGETAYLGPGWLDALTAPDAPEMDPDDVRALSF